MTAFIRSIEVTVRCNETQIEELNLEIQDILHEIEFNDIPTRAKEAIAMLKNIQRVRRERRILKEESESLLAYFTDKAYISQNLGDITGEMRSIVERQKNRQYSPRVKKLASTES